MPWVVMLVDEVREWYLTLVDEDPDTAERVTAAIDLLEERGPALGRPLVDRIKGSSLANLNELRPGSSGRSEVRILFAFDPLRRAVLLAAGDKAGRWSDWYVRHIAIAEERFNRWLEHGDV
jgi:hypothetical protein